MSEQVVRGTCQWVMREVWLTKQDQGDVNDWTRCERYVMDWTRFEVSMSELGARNRSSTEQDVRDVNGWTTCERCQWPNNMWQVLMAKQDVESATATKTAMQSVDAKVCNSFSVNGTLHVRQFSASYDKIVGPRTTTMFKFGSTSPPTEEFHFLVWRLYE